jgi:hypothetical protein
MILHYYSEAVVVHVNKFFRFLLANISSSIQLFLNQHQIFDGSIDILFCVGVYPCEPSGAQLQLQPT